MQKLLFGVLFWAMSAVYVQAQDLNWLYLTNRAEFAQSFQNAPYPVDAELCVIEGWTPENSGVQHLAKDWQVSVTPSAPNNPHALELILATIDLSSDGECDFVAVPWYVPPFRKPIGDRIANRRMLEIVGLSTLQVGSTVGDANTSSVSSSSNAEASQSGNSTAQPAWRYFATEHMIKVDPTLFDPSGGMNGTKVCSIGNLTILNSGFPRVAPNWFIMPYPSPTSEQEAIKVTQDVVRSRHCLIVAIPRNNHAQLEVVLRDLKKSKLAEIPMMSNPEPPTIVVVPQKKDMGQSADTPVELETVAVEVQALCSRDPRLNVDFDCDCIARNIQSGISQGDLSQTAGSNFHFNRLLKHGDPACVNDAAIREDIIADCPNLMVFTFQDTNLDCDCLADYAIAKFRENPLPRQREKILLSRPAEAQRCSLN